MMKREGEFEAYSTSICPECLRRVPMRIYEEDGVIYLEKECPEHGRFEDVYWGDAELYKWFYKEWNSAKYLGSGVEEPHTKVEDGCPYDCGLCPQHKSSTILGIIDVTNRCNMACPICFAYAGAANYVYEPTYDQIVEMIKVFRSNSPWPCNALQFSGGEPTLRNDLPGLVMEAKKAGIKHVEVNTNGIRLAEDIEYFRSLYKAGLNTIYLQFDGLREEIYEKLRGRRGLIPIKKRVLENAREIGLRSIVLVVTLAKGVNDRDLGEIIEFAVENSDIIRCVNIQPISMAGRAQKEQMRRLRITVPDAIRLIEEQTGGRIHVKDWRPVNWPVPIARGMEILKGRMYPEFTMHPMCGASTFIVIEEDSYSPITRHVDVDRFAEVFWSIYYHGVRGKKARAKAEALKFLPIIKSDLFRDILKGIVRRGSIKALGALMYKVIMIGIMHFQDVWNMDLDRVQRCAIHYATPDGKLRAFCTYNSIHRERVEKQFAVPIREWTEKTGKKVNEPA